MTDFNFTSTIHDAKLRNGQEAGYVPVTRSLRGASPPRLGKMHARPTFAPLCQVAILIAVRGNLRKSLSLQFRKCDVTRIFGTQQDWLVVRASFSLSQYAPPPSRAVAGK